jgi:hypothetical protein
MNEHFVIVNKKKNKKDPFRQKGDFFTAKNIEPGAPNFFGL